MDQTTKKTAARRQDGPKSGQRAQERREFPAESGRAPRAERRREAQTERKAPQTPPAGERWGADAWERELAAIRAWDPVPRKEAEEPEAKSARRSAPRSRSAETRSERPGVQSQARRAPRPASRTERARQAEAELSGLSAVFYAMSQRSLRFRRRWRRLVRENRTHRFPESNRPALQMLLFIWSILPMWGNRFHERLFLRSQRARQRNAVRSAHAGRWRVHPAVFLCGGCVAAALLLFFSMYTTGTTVIYDGKVIGCVASEAAAERARTELEKVTAQTLGRTYTIDDSLIQYDSGLFRRQDLVDVKTYQEELSEELGVVTLGYGLYVDGERIGATPYEGALEALLEQMELSATNEGTISVGFAENVEVKKEYVATEDLVNLGYLAETLYSTKTAEVTYTVAKGDTWSEIAENHGLTSKELLALNPGYNIDKLQIGESLIMSASVPYLTMTVVQQERYVDSVPFEIEYTDTADLYKGDFKVTSAGQYGASDVMANVTYVNGEETERIILSSVTLREPVTEQQLRGTKERPTWHPTGTFRWPVTGRITSRFGGRKSPGGIGSTNHKGIDIAAPRGTPVYASDGGTVTYAGWMGGYGYLVQIDHGNGYVTRYGHNSSLTCSVGQHVYKGQQIARVGSTGNSTGNHCHFEVRYNGVARNPLNYL